MSLPLDKYLDDEKMKRSSFETAMELLEIIEKNGVPTKIMYAANMSWNRFIIIVERLKIMGLIDENVLGVNDIIRPRGRISQFDTRMVLWRTDKRVQRRYTLTDKGKEVLSLVKDLKEKMEGFSVEKDIIVSQ